MVASTDTVGRLAKKETMEAGAVKDGRELNKSHPVGMSQNTRALPSNDESNLANSALCKRVSSNHLLLALSCFSCQCPFQWQPWDRREKYPSFATGDRQSLSEQQELLGTEEITRDVKLARPLR